MKTPQKEGASREEIYDTILIACLVGKTKVMSPALRIFTDCGLGGGLISVTPGRIIAL